MLPSPTSSPPRSALWNSTNLRNVPCPLPTPPEHAKAKRPRSVDFDTVEPIKRPKLSPKEHSDSDDSDSDSDADALRVVRRRRTTIFDAMATNASRMGPSSRLMRPSTQTIIQNFVSSHTTDRYVCHSDRTASFLTPPYSCAYSNAAKNGGAAHLAVATEQGSVYIWDTARRNGCRELGPQRTDLHIHDNGIFDVSWSASDNMLATASGDHTTRIIDTTTGKGLYVLQGHTTTVKAVTWNPSNPSLLSTGGRDGCICLWDLRCSERHLRRDGDSDVMGPETLIKGAHDDASQTPARGRGKKAKKGSGRTITSVVCSPHDPYGLISSGSFDGILRYWDLRFPSSGRKSKSVLPHHASVLDPTTLHGARRPRGITSLVAGIGCTTGLLFGLGFDSRIHTYATPSLDPLTADTNCFSHPNMMTNSFYSRLSLSPDGRWLASGSTKTTAGGSAFVFDVAHAGRVDPGPVSTQGVRLTAQNGEVCAVDWAGDSLATCTDDGTVRIWRNDPEVRWQCEADWRQDADWAWGVVNGP